MHTNENLYELWLSWLKSLRSSLRKLRQDMVNHNIDLDEDFLGEGKRHSFDTYINGQHERGFYEYHLYPFGSAGPALMATYGIVNKTKYEYIETV